MKTFIKLMCLTKENKHFIATYLSYKSTHLILIWKFVGLPIGLATEPKVLATSKALYSQVDQFLKM